jgi:para-nitrobenzyl esterase
MSDVVSIAQGQLRGVVTDGVRSFKGIPYAAAPFGALRFHAPELAPGWGDIRDASDYGPTVPKPPYPAPIDQLLPEPVIAGTDCLNLNVWTPADAVGLPVLVWIHGGAFVNGSGAVSLYDGSAFARDGIVCVTINYRLGVDGFAAIEGAVANRGLLDQVAALQWVRANISAFGGDPSQITIAGESAGAMSVTSLVSMPLAQGLFHRAIAQSGAGHHVLSLGTATRVAAELADRLGVEPTMDGFASVPVGQLIAVQSRFGSELMIARDAAKWPEIVLNQMPFEPVVDGTVLPSRPIEAILDGAGAGVTMMTGTNTDEEALFLVPSGIQDHLDDVAVRSMLGRLGANAESATDIYRTARPGATAGQLYSAAMTDWFFRIPAIRLAEAVAHPAFMYEFGWPSPMSGLGACHALEIGFVFDRLDDPSGRPMLGDRPPQSVADEMHTAWVNFIRTGAPGWPAYLPGRTVKVFAEKSDIIDDPRSEERLVWQGIR